MVQEGNLRDEQINEGWNKNQKEEEEKEGEISIFCITHEWNMRVGWRERPRELTRRIADQCQRSGLLVQMKLNYSPVFFSFVV